MRAEFALRIKNATASCAVVALAYAGFVIAPYNWAALSRLYGPPQFAFSGGDFLFVVSAAYMILLTMYFLTQRNESVSKSLRFFAVLRSLIRAPRHSLHNKLAPDDRVAVLSTLLKSFFAPLMAIWLMAHCMGAWVNGLKIMEAGIEIGTLLDVFNSVGFWFLMQSILFVDVLIFTIGYLVESRRLGNKIRSVDPTLLGWAATLLCYPPLNIVTSKILGSPVSDFPQFDNPAMHVALNLLLLLLMGIFASASVALGLKASNLTHRGIVMRGPYAMVRHPAYASKNMAWWISAAPLVLLEFHSSIIDGLLATASMMAWTLLYVLRALTEEDHLRSVDEEYTAYTSKVRYRFIPGVV